MTEKTKVETMGIVKVKVMVMMVKMVILLSCLCLVLSKEEETLAGGFSGCFRSWSWGCQCWRVGSGGGVLGIETRCGWGWGCACRACETSHAADPSLIHGCYAPAQEEKTLHYT